MANTNLTVDWIGNEALRLAHEKASFIGTINREFDASYKPGYGNTIRIRIPSQYVTRSGRVMDVQDGVQQSTALTVATQWGVDLRYNSQEMAQDLVNFQKLHLEPAMAQLVSYLDGACLSSATQQTANEVGTAGTAITGLSQTGLARARLNQFLAPKDARRIQFDSVNMANVVSSQAAYYPSGAISENYREGLIARTAMADFYENERVYSHTNQSTVAGWLSTSIVAPTNQLVVSSLGAINVGSVFSLRGPASTVRGFAVHPETKAAYGQAMQFVVTAFDGATSTITFQPPIFTTGARKNIANSDGTDFTTTGAYVTTMVLIEKAASSTYATPLMYHRDAFTFATAALPLMDDAIRCVVKTYDGISLRVWEGSDIRNDEKLTRIDILWGFAAIRPQWACRIIGLNV